MIKKLIQNTRNIFFILLALILPFSVAASNIVLGLVCIFVFLELFVDLMEGNLMKNIKKVFSSKWMLSIIFLLLLYFFYTAIFGISKDTVWILKRSSLLFALPILYAVQFDKNIIKISIFMFFISMFFSCLIAIGINYDIIYKLDDITKLRYAAFLKYTDHNVFLVVSIILSIFSVIHIKMKNNFRYIILFFIPVYLFSFITERGVAAWIIFIIFISALLVYIFRKNITLAILAFCGILLCSYFIYNNSQVIQRMVTYKTKHILTDERIVFLDNTLEMIESQPIIGYGPGSWRDVFNRKSERVPDRHNTPHNNYLYVWMELGILGLILLLSIFYFHIREIYKKGIIATLFPFMFLILMLFDSYLFSQNTLILYIIFSIISVNFQNKLA